MIEVMFGRTTRLAVAVAALAVIGLGSPAARAQSQDDSAGTGWFDNASAPAASSNGAPATNSNAQPQQTLTGSSSQSASDTYSDTDPSAVTDFRGTLSPYGHWVQDPTYGLVWVPDESAVGPHFAPYLTDGHWAVTAGGDWMWVSDYPFGWVVFHYGRWVWINGTGWAWIAGRRYANAWVEWRLPDDGYDYVGWAPLPPAWGWWDGAAVTLWFAPPAAYVFCPSDDLFDDDVPRYIVHDHDRLDWVAHHSYRYRNPSGGMPRHTPAFSQAHVSPGARPTHHTPANPRALAASRPSTAARAFRGTRAFARPRSFAGASRSPSFRSRTIGSGGFARRPARSWSRAGRPGAFRSTRPFNVRSARQYRVMRGPGRFSAPARRGYIRSRGYRGFRSYRFSRAPRYAPSRSFVRTRSFGRMHMNTFHGGFHGFRGGFHGGFHGGFAHVAHGRR